MTAAVRAELLRTVSGTALLAVPAFAVLVPLMMLVVAPGGRPSADSATVGVYSACAASFVTAMFLGSYSVTREFYYGSLERALVVVRRADLLRAKAAASALVSAVLGAATAAGWLAVTAIIVTSNGSSFDPSRSMGSLALGSIVSSLLGGVLGSAVGWVTRNYYAACVVVLGVPFAVELPLLTTAPEIARFLPSGALAGIAAPEHLGLLPSPLALLVALAWCALAGAAAWVVTMRSPE